MRKLIFTLVLTVFIYNFSYSQKSDKELIKETLSFYMDGGTNGDFETLKKAFHENATMKFIRNGEYKAVKVIPYFKEGMKNAKKQNRKTRITNIDVTGHAANARIELIYGSSVYVDYMNLLKIEGKWQIVGKIFSKQ